ncbi:MAG: aminoacyl-tRNA hydrolase [Candidatus Paceibacterota bacterium]|jgi:PTH1 family peptidyl-tRNA hydrolase
MSGKFNLVIGLGNPGPEYKKTYHNIGFLATDFITTKSGFKKFSKSSTKKFEFLEVKNTIICRPLTFMNDSGQAVVLILKYFKIKPENILVIHDDSDLEIGKYKLVYDRGSAGHKGIISVINHLKTKKIWRLRIGIRPKPNNNDTTPQKRIKAEKFVLKDIKPTDQKIFDHIFGEITEKVIGNE